MANEILTTGDVKWQYEIIDTIFAIDSHKDGFWGTGADPNKAFAAVKEKLRQTCQKLGGKAVINCQFEYRNAMDGKKQVIEIFAYGTAIKY